MKRRKNECANENSNSMQTDNTKRSRSRHNDENRNPNINHEGPTSNVQVKGIFNRLLGGISNIPGNENEVSASTVVVPSSSIKRRHETGYESTVISTNSLRSAKKNARTQIRPAQVLQNITNTTNPDSEVVQTPLDPKKVPEKNPKKLSPPSVNSKKATKGIILTNPRNSLRFAKSLSKEKQTTKKSCLGSSEGHSDGVLHSEEEAEINMTDHQNDRAAEEKLEQVYDCSSAYDTDSEASVDYECIEDIPIEVKQRYEFLTLLDESLTKAFVEKKTTNVSSRKKQQTGTI
ncbi:predicted protein [Arabidopsis lyrata subsp. lyrata]|uniref:Predicted protein n=1 Tax=Arabidopsis lyrata subsp. lyrata TaxID=81972 RepID=D7L129_ARALL|nr:predicted protein [Arabidopsis lyrata subsp. lyrata]